MSGECCLLRRPQRRTRDSEGCRPAAAARAVDCKQLSPPPPPFWMFEEAGENSRIGNQEFGIENWEFENLHAYRLLCVWFPCLKDLNFSYINFIHLHCGVGIWGAKKKKKTKRQMWRGIRPSRSRAVRRVRLRTLADFLLPVTSQISSRRFGGFSGL